MSSPEEPVYTSASCDNCEWVGATGRLSILSFAQEHADLYDHRLRATAWDHDTQIVVATIAVGRQ